jgi:phenylacetate-coenzyme A ligase PaaK-like adenylate-forming protein
MTKVVGMPPEFVADARNQPWRAGQEAIAHTLAYDARIMGDYSIPTETAGSVKVPTLVLAGEVFSEEWRTLVGQRTGSRQPYFDSVSLYGTADAGVLGNETPLSIAIRRFLARRRRSRSTSTS